MLSGLLLLAPRLEPQEGLVVSVVTEPVSQSVSEGSCSALLVVAEAGGSAAG